MHGSEGNHRDSRTHKQLRSRRQRRRALIRSIYLLPSTATLGNAVCGFAAIYIASLTSGNDPLTQEIIKHKFDFAAYLIFLAMVFDALDGRLARFTRHTTDFGGQLDSMADVISFGVAPAVLMLQMTKVLTLAYPGLWHAVTRIIWGIGAVYACCAAIRLARFNVSNQHGEQHHFSFLGLPSPAAGGTVAAVALMCLALGRAYNAADSQSRMAEVLGNSYLASIWLLPVITLTVGLLMVSTIRYPHVVNRYLRGRKSIGRLVGVVLCVGLVIAFHQYAIAIAMIAYTAWGIIGWALSRFRRVDGTTGKPAVV